jgi:uncharacterized protein YbjT (DUF2867 family)
LRVALWGASGVTGGALLRRCLEEARIARVVSFGRRGLERQEARLEQRIIDRFGDAGCYEGALANIDVAFWCLGVSQSAVSDEVRYREITVGYAIAAVEALQAASPKAAFHFVSGMGAGTGAGRFGVPRPMWARVKGEAEEALAESALHRLVVWRPGYIDVPGGRPAPTGFERCWEILSPLFRLVPNLVNPVDDIARAMLADALHHGLEPGREIRESKAIRRMAGKFAESAS